jgi:subtilisin-like proprotein convertase family protein
MQIKRNLTAVAGAAALASMALAMIVPDAAHAAPVAVSNPAPINPPDGNPAGVTSTLTVSGKTGHISDLNVTVNDISTTFIADLDIALTGPNGKSVMLISDTCTSNDWSVLDITIDDEAAQTFGNTANCLTATSTWPVDLTPGTDPGFPAVPNAGTLAAFDGASPNGNWVLTVADDLMGDPSQIAGGFTLTMELTDEVAPVTTITKKPNKSTTKSSAKIAFSSNESGSTFECNLDGQGWNTCKSPLKLKKLTPGKHKVQVRATDLAKNTGPAAKASWKVKP